MKTILEQGQAKQMTFEEVYYQYQPLVKKIANKWGGIEDSKQIADIELWNAYKKYDAMTGVTFAHFAGSVIYKKFLKLYRDTQVGKRKGEVFELDEKRDINAEDENINLKADLKNIIVKLPQEQKEIVILTYYGYTQHEIAKILNTYQTRIFRELRKAKEKLLRVC